MDEKKALRISNREQAVELFATNPDIEAELENDIPSMVSALKREVLAGNVQATRLMFEYMNKLQKNINITIDSPFENWMKKQDFGEVVDAEIIVNMDEFKELPPRTANNSHLEVHKERIRVQNAPQKAKSLNSHNKTRREQYKWVKRAKAVGVEKLPGKRPTPGQKKAWQESIIKLEKKAS
jgi:hypothetical protein